MLALPVGVTEKHCHVREQIEHCGFFDHEDGDKLYKSAIVVHYLMKIIEVALKSICTS